MTTCYECPDANRDEPIEIPQAISMGRDLRNPVVDFGIVEFFTKIQRRIALCQNSLRGKREEVYIVLYDKLWQVS